MPTGFATPLRLLAVLALVCATLGAASAQTDVPPAPGARIDQVRAELDQIEATLKRDSLDDATLGALRARIEPLSAAVDDAVAQLQPQLKAADARLEQIGAPPAEGQPAESPDVAKEREAQTGARQKIDEQIKRGRLLQVEAAQVGDDITQRRRGLLAQRLFERSRSLLDPTLWVEVTANATRDFAATGLIFSDWRAVVSRNLSPASIGTALAATLAALLLLFPGRRWIISFGNRLALREAPRSHLRRSATGMMVVLGTTLTPALAVFVLYEGLKVAGWMPMRAEPLLQALVAAAGFLGLVQGLMRAFLNPRHPAWRLVNLSDAAVAVIKNQPLWCALVFVLGRLVDRFNDLIVASLAVSIVTTGVFAVLNAGTFALALRRLRAAERIEDAAAAEGKTPERFGSPLLSLLRLLAWAAIIVVLLSAATGYVALAQFLANQVIWIATVLTLLFLLLTFVDDLLTTGLSAQTGLGRAASEAIGVRASSLEQVGVVLSGVARVTLLGFALLILAAPWGLETTDVFGWVRVAFTGVQIGDISISLSGVFGALALVFLGFALTRVVQRWLDRDLLPKTRLDTGLKASINTAVGYVGGLLVIVIAVSYLGFSLDRLAIVAGALSVGIGFGLQSIISNFVSGVILLAERPIKAGDWIVIGADQGNVRRISVRSTEIELFDRSTLIVPNSDFITKSVKNVTHGAPVGRVQIEITAAADVDPTTVRRILLETAKAHGSVLGFPEPQVFFNSLGKADNGFTLFASVPSPRQAATVKSDLNFALVKAFKDQGVAIGGAAAPSLPDAVDRIGEALARFTLRPAEPAAARPHEASDAPLSSAPRPEPQP
ncbi:mechanosensitive ion channel protein MscS [Methylopila jiangsuensis]|uniref:Mechanosensitive ion channel protein MscS n=1 Tax=Methylopila jiangsuensis TaxID=586230 RepID=A0A9W6N3S5_9HYPH|nr:DUF3772 domain-containing protein [Methylopila jiangsuensis]MDR6287158.1 small-conductance mechanosensitive channel [Methylopila jiangsuensis]GLK76645.1 mechanosensitive ion channel protein MscS [Methylopila jiangsuensis]